MAWNCRSTSLRQRLRGTDRGRVDRSVALVMVTGTELQMWFGAQVHDRVAASIAGAVVCGCVGVRRRWPSAALLVGVGATAVEAALGGAFVQGATAAIPAAILLFYAAGAFLPTRSARGALLIGVALLIVQVVQTPDLVSDLFFEPGLLALVPWACGRGVRADKRRERIARAYSEQLDSGLELGASHAGDEERLHIARELHDVIGHCLSVAVLQAGGARMILDAQPERADAAMHVVQQAGHDALGELRRLLDVFADDDSRVPLAPQPGLADLDELVSRTRVAGLDIDLCVDGQERPISPALALCAYRIVQEALTNTMKYAGAAHAAVRVSWAADQLGLEITDDGPGDGPPTERSDGHGLVGMRERASLHDGTLDAGPATAGGYVVAASLPLSGEPAR